MDFARLKQHTQSQHDRLEAHPLTAQLMQDTLTTATYLHILQAFYGYYAAIEQQLVQWEEELPMLDLPQRYKAQLLLNDIQYLNPTVSAAHIRLCDDVPLCHTPANVFGCVYVLEGATLGGQIISRRLAKQLEISPGEGLSFFKGYGAKTGPLWMAFRQVVTDCVQDTQTEVAVIDAARRTFDTFEAWLTNYG